MSWEQIARAHGHIFCQKEKTHCINVDLGTGACMADHCILYDEEYMKLEEIIRQNVENNFQKNIDAKNEEKNLLKVVKNQSKILENQKQLEYERLVRIASEQRSKGHYITANKIEEKANAILWEVEK